MGFPGLFILLIFAPTMAWVESRSQGLPRLDSGRSLAVEKEDDFLASPNGTFSSGFYKVGINAYCFSIWFTTSVNKTVVWMANRDKPVNGKGSKLTLHGNGNLVLTDADSSVIWSTDTFTNEDVEARLLETGNLVLINQANMTIWKSFDFPTDTLLPSQLFTKNLTLVSKRSAGTYLSGFYNLKFDDSSVLNLIYNGPLISSVYWPNTALTIFKNGRTPYNSSRRAYLNAVGLFTSSDNFGFNASDYGVGPNRRLTLDYDGIPRLYSLDGSTGLWKISWLAAGLDKCLVHGLCGSNGICTYSPGQATCICPNRFKRNDPSDWSKGCSPLFNLTCNSTEFDFMELHNTDYYGYDLVTYGLGISLHECRNRCLSDCKCKGFGYSTDGQGQCFPKSDLLNGYNMPSKSLTMHIKIPSGTINSSAELGKISNYPLNCSDAEIVLGDYNAGEEKASKNRYLIYLIAFAGSFAVIEIVCISLGWWYVFRKHVNEELINLGYIALAMGFKRFTYAELKRATKNFKQVIGKGGFGTVYKGLLDDERVVAVKRLEGILQGDAEFWAEVSIIGTINHRNLVKLWGFCAENEHKLLVYEYVENGSLDKILFSDSSSTLEWKERYNIAVEIAKGLSYLHEECLEWVLHCDVKPQNILLNDQLEPKVADFGMSKLFQESYDDAKFSRVRGTRGYLAPEWMMNRKINAKADVYSYGIVLLELLSGKSASGFHSATGLPNEFNHLVQWVTELIKQEGLEKIIDPRLNNEYNMEELDRMVKVALLCVADNPDARPPMSKVVELLTANEKISV